jgi:hypothetical protein
MIRTLASPSSGFVTYSGLEFKSRIRLRSAESAVATMGAVGSAVINANEIAVLRSRILSILPLGPDQPCLKVERIHSR